MPARVRILNSKTLYTGKVLQLRLDRVIEPGGVPAEREVVEHAGSVVVLPYLSDGRIVLVRQFRYATGKWLWELVAGGIETGETPGQAARRELLEETGYLAREFRRLFSFYPSPGFLSERMVLVEARGLIQSKAQPEPDERITVGRFRAAQLRRMLYHKKIEDAKTLVALFWALGFKPFKG